MELIQELFAVLGNFSVVQSNNEEDFIVMSRDLRNDGTEHLNFALGFIGKLYSNLS